MNRPRPESMSHVKRANTPHMRQVIAAFCRTAVDDYRQAGCPFGAHTDGMLLWFEFGQQTTRN